MKRPRAGKKSCFRTPILKWPMWELAVLFCGRENMKRRWKTLNWATTVNTTPGPFIITGGKLSAGTSGWLSGSCSPSYLRFMLSVEYGRKAGKAPTGSTKARLKRYEIPGQPEVFALRNFSPLQGFLGPETREKREHLGGLDLSCAADCHLYFAAAIHGFYFQRE